MRLRREMHNRVCCVFNEQVLYQLQVTNIAMHKAISRLSRHRLQIGPIARIRQRIEDHDTIIRLLRCPVANKIGADKTSAAGNEQATHRRPRHSGTHLPRLFWTGAAPAHPLTAS